MRARVLGFLARWLRLGLLAALVVLPLAIEQAIERTSFDDRLGTFPVEVSLAHNGVSTLDAGLIGSLYWERTGVGGFGASLRSTGPPEAGGTLTSYVEPEFLQANAAFVDDPSDVAATYGRELRSQLVRRIAAIEAVAAVAGGLVGALVLGPSRGGASSRRRRLIVRGTAGVVVDTASTVFAVALFTRWAGNEPTGERFAMPGIPELSFSSAQTREVAIQIQPFLEKNNDRIRERADAYEAAALESMVTVLGVQGDGLVPADGEVVVLTEADPQGSQVATRVRTAIYPLLLEVLGDEAAVLRTIAGDVTSNGAVAESGYVRREAAALPEVPLVAVKGDHDSVATVDQLRSGDAEVLDLEVVEVGDLRVAGAADPAFKSLFGGLITNPSGVTEEQTGQALREVVDDQRDGGAEGDIDAVQVVVHQPSAAAGYLGIETTTVLPDGDLTTPYDDGIADVPPGTVSIGHLHDAEGPWVIWNTDGDQVTWTVVSQLGTSGGVEERPTFNRFSTPFSVPLKDVTVQLNYLNPQSGLQTGYARVVIGVDGQVRIEERVDVGLPGGVPAVP
jgi:hypothetical protein